MRYLLYRLVDWITPEFEKRRVAELEKKVDMLGKINFRLTDLEKEFHQAMRTLKLLVDDNYDMKKRDDTIARGVLKVRKAIGTVKNKSGKETLDSFSEFKVRQKKLIEDIYSKLGDVEARQIFEDKEIKLHVSLGDEITELGKKLSLLIKKR